ncbi:MAG: alpha/beta hydrolase, partial [bacterium]|nr:alpha/beta hydrolase [bacterium]
RTPSFYGWSYEDVVVPVGDETTHGWYIPVEDARGTVLFSHGNAGTIADRLESCAFFRELGFNVLVYDYGGYGKSSGGVSEQRCYADIRAIWRYLTDERGIDSKKIVLFGRSLGGGPTVDFAAEITNAEGAPAAVILESTFLSTGQVGQDAFPFLPVKWLIRHRFDNAAKIGRVNGPLLIIHSPQDDIIPYKHGAG